MCGVALFVTCEKIVRFGIVTKMTKSKKQIKKIKIIAWSLFGAAILVEALNIFLAFKLGRIQAHTCPKNDLPGQLVVMLTILSSVFVFISARLAGKYKTIAYLCALMWMILIAIGALFLYMIAQGGINWCNWTF